MTQWTSEAAGDSRYELLREPLSEFLEDAEALATSAWRESRPGENIFVELPGLTTGLLRARGAARRGKYRRSEMPVIDEVDLEDLKADLLLTGVAAEPNCTITPMSVWPSQRQIYADKSITRTAKAGVVGTLMFLKRNHLVITQDGFIVDGHHRWLSASLINESVILPAFRIPEDYIQVRPEILRFSDARHPRNL